MEIVEVKNDVGVDCIQPKTIEIKCPHCGSILKISVKDVEHFNYCIILPSQKYNGEFETQNCVEWIKKSEKNNQNESLLKRIRKSIIDFVSDGSDCEKIVTQKEKKIIYPYRAEKVFLNYTQCPVCCYNIDVDYALVILWMNDSSVENKVKKFQDFYPCFNYKVYYIYPSIVKNIENYIIKKYWFKEDFEIPKEFYDLCINKKTSVDDTNLTPLEILKLHYWETSIDEDTLEQLAKKYNLSFGFEGDGISESIYLFDDYKDRIKELVSGNKKYKQYIDKIIIDVYTHLKCRTYGKSVEDGLKILDEHINHIKNNILKFNCKIPHFKPVYNYQLDYQYKQYEKLVKDLEQLKNELENESKS